MKRGQLIFVRGDSWISKIINRLDGKYSHVALALSEETILEAQRFTESRIVKNYHVDYDAITLDLSEEQMKKLIDSSLENIGYDYDYKQVAFTLFNSLFKIARYNDRDKFICSEIIVEVLYDIGYLNGEDYANLQNATPNELYNYLEENKN